MLPLSVYCCVFDPSEFPFATYVPRIGKARLDFEPTDEEILSAYYCDIVRSLISRQNPATMKLSIFCFGEIRFRFKEDSFGASYGSLTSLRLISVDLESTPVLGGLRSLELLRNEVKANELHRLLCHAPLLETLFLDDTSITHLPPDGAGPLDVVDLPRLRELHVTEDNRNYMAFALSILPDPSTELALGNTSVANEGSLNSQGGFDSIVTSRMRQFWQRRTGLSTLPLLSLTAEDLGGHEEGNEDTEEWEEYIYLLRIDDPDGFHEPTRTKLSWTTNCIITAPDPILATITRFTLLLNGDRIRLEGNRNHLNVALLTHLKHVDIHEAFTAEDSWPRIGAHNLAELEAWIRTFADAGRPLETLTFKDCNPEMRGFVEKIEESGWVKEVLWVLDSSESEA
jgi:hypothetical protein